jgi:DNA repair protein RadC
MKTLYVHRFAKASHEEVLEAAESILADRARNSIGVLGLDGGPYVQLRHHLRGYKATVFGAIYIGRSSTVMAVEDLLHGSRNEDEIDLMELVRSSQKHFAKSVIFFHYYESCSPDATTDDIQFVRSLAQTLSKINVDVADLWILDGIRFQSLEALGLKL